MLTEIELGEAVELIHGLRQLSLDHDSSLHDELKSYLDWADLYLEHNPKQNTIDTAQVKFYAERMGYGYKTANLMVMANHS